MKKKYEIWLWFDPKIEHDWYRHQMNEMYALLTPNERHELANEMTREERLMEFHDEVIP